LVFFLAKVSVNVYPLGQGYALPTELFSHYVFVLRCKDKYFFKNTKYFFVKNFDIFIYEWIY